MNNRDGMSTDVRVTSPQDIIRKASWLTLWNLVTSAPHLRPVMTLLVISHRLAVSSFLDQLLTRFSARPTALPAAVTSRIVARSSSANTILLFENFHVG